MPDPAVLRALVEEYETLTARAGSGTADVDQRAQDVAYTLCVSTGTRDVRSALDVARRRLATAPEPGPVVPMASRPTGTGVAEARDLGEAVA
ncbi:DUF5133 domain-containing protein [Streptomyces sp. NPDC002701]|uniref:DUF5133 domain-containing protein n=1 Tax=unclassified Streptomyces TaxID=2593676 RepID=UPI003688CC60